MSRISWQILIKFKGTYKFLLLSSTQSDTAPLSKLFVRNLHFSRYMRGISSLEERIIQEKKGHGCLQEIKSLQILKWIWNWTGQFVEAQISAQSIGKQVRFPLLFLDWHQCICASKSNQRTECSKFLLLHHQCSLGWYQWVSSFSGSWDTKVKSKGHPKVEWKVK